MMKKSMIVLILCMIFSLSATESIPEKSLSIKNYVFSLETRINDHNASIYGPSYEPDFYLTDFFQYLHDCEQENPEAVNLSGKAVILEKLSCIEKLCVNLPDDFNECMSIFNQICDYVDEICEEVLFRP